MGISETWSRRSFLTLIAAASAAPLAASNKHVPVGLELYSVRGELQKDWTKTLEGVAKIGYECVEFYAPYYEWDLEHGKDVRKKLDDLGLRCYSTHNEQQAFAPKGIGKAIELNQVLGTHYVVLAHPGSIDSLDGWKQVADVLNKGNQTMSAHGLRAGYHNHDAEWKLVDGQRPMEVLASNTDRRIMLQLDVGTCLEAGSDPVAWINANPGRVRSLHLKEWSPEKGYRVLFGEGVAPWENILAAAEAKGGVEFYLIEQEGSQYPEMETADRCLVAYRNLRG